jgi:hypothetical protein
MRKVRCNSAFFKDILRKISISITPRLHFTPGKGSPVPIVQEAGWASEPVWTQRLEEKIRSPLLAIEPRSPGRPARRYTDWATLFQTYALFPRETTRPNDVIACERRMVKASGSGNFYVLLPASEMCCWIFAPGSLSVPLFSLTFLLSENIRWIQRNTVFRLKWNPNYCTWTLTERRNQCQYWTFL